MRLVHLKFLLSLCVVRSIIFKPCILTPAGYPWLSFDIPHPCFLCFGSSTLQVEPVPDPTDSEHMFMLECPDPFRHTMAGKA